MKNVVPASSLTTRQYTFNYAEGRTLSVLADSEAQARAACSFGVSENAAVVSVEEVAYLHGEKSTATAAELSALTGTPWQATPASRNDLRTHYRLCRRSDGLALWFVSASWNDAAKASASYDRPRFENRWVDVFDAAHVKVSDPFIGFDTAKSPAAIAKDILRRLLPECEAVHLLVLDALVSAEARATRRKEACDVVTKLPPVAGLRFSAEGEHVSVTGYLTPAEAVALHTLLSSKK